MHPLADFGKSAGEIEAFDAAVAELESLRAALAAAEARADALAAELTAIREKESQDAAGWEWRQNRDQG